MAVPSGNRRDVWESQRARLFGDCVELYSPEAVEQLDEAILACVHKYGPQWEMMTHAMRIDSVVTQLMGPGLRTGFWAEDVLAAARLAHSFTEEFTP